MTKNGRDRKRREIMKKRRINTKEDIERKIMTQRRRDMERREIVRNRRGDNERRWREIEKRE